jgi:hypothetical protein
MEVDNEEIEILFIIKFNVLFIFNKMSWNKADVKDKFSGMYQRK